MIESLKQQFALWMWVTIPGWFWRLLPLSWRMWAVIRMIRGGK